MTRILGIDPGLTRCGVGLIELGAARKLEFLHVEVLRSGAGDPLPQRLLQLGSAIERILDADCPPTEIALERVFVGENLPSVMGVAQISGVILYAAAKRGIAVKLYTPNEVKAQVTGYGAADKTQVTSMVTKILRLQAAPKPADAADALALAITHAWSIARAGALSPAGAAAAAGVKLQARAGTLTPAQQVWAAAEQQAGLRRKNKRR